LKNSETWRREHGGMNEGNKKSFQAPKGVSGTRGSQSFGRAISHCGGATSPRREEKKENRAKIDKDVRSHTTEYFPNKRERCCKIRKA